MVSIETSPRKIHTKAACRKRIAFIPAEVTLSGLVRSVRQRHFVSPLHREATSINVHRPALFDFAGWGSLRLNSLSGGEVLLSFIET